MPSKKKVHKAAAARDQAANVQKKIAKLEISPTTIEQSISDLEPAGNCNSYIECTGWTGGVGYVPSDTDMETDDSDMDWKDTHLDGECAGSDSEDSEEGGEDLEDLEGQDLLDGLRNKWELLQQELEDLEKPTPYECILKKTTTKMWKQAEASQGLGYNGQSARRKREIAQEQREKEEQDRVIRNRWVLHLDGPNVPLICGL